MRTRVEWVEDAAGWAALGAPWRELTASAPGPFGDFDWFDAWWRAFGGGTVLAVCTAWQGDALTAVMPLLRRGGTLAAMANTETPSFRAGARDASALATVCRAVLSAAPRVELWALPRDEPLLQALRDAAPGARRLDRVQAQFFSPVTDTADGWEIYRAAMKDRWREVERRARKTAREHEVQLRCLVAPLDVERELEEGLALEASGWKGESGSAILSSAALRSFYVDLAARAHARGQLRVSSLHVDGRLAAFDLALLHGHRYHLLKTAYDESLRHLGPGLTLRRAVIERCFEEGLEAHEFLGANMPWKQLFAQFVRPHVRYSAYSRHPMGAARWAYEGKLRPRLKRALGRPAATAALPAAPPPGEGAGRSA